MSDVDRYENEGGAVADEPLNPEPDVAASEPEAPAVDPSVARKPASQQAEAAGKVKWSATRAPEYDVASEAAANGEGGTVVRQVLTKDAEQYPLNQRPIEEASQAPHTAQASPYDDGVTIDPGVYHKPGAPLPPETEAEQQPAPQPTLHHKREV
jgi:hypothetical protein